MYRIIEKKSLNPQVKLMVVEAPVVAKKAKPGQFIILRVSDEGERIPLTIAGYDRDAGTITIVFQEVGKTTRALGQLEVGEGILDFVGPLGIPSHVDGIKKACVIGGGLGTAIAWPQAKHLHEAGAEVHMICGFRNKDLIILEDEIRASSDRAVITTDDGSNGVKGFVTDQLKGLIAEGNQYDVVIAIGPLVMMKFVSQLTKPLGIKTIVSLNPVMIDGTGMCGGCRVTVGGKTKFACVDGPDFDGHEVDFDEAIRRSSMYKDEEKKSDDLHACRMGGLANG
jgi:ferredoxin--NADP+ reductase